MAQPPDIGQNTDGAISNISDFRISGQFLIKVNRTNDDIEMKLGPVTKLDKRNKTMSRRFEDNAVSANYDVIVIFTIYGQLGAIQKPDSGRIVCKTYIFLNSNLLCYKT